jgi:tRNA pseudouridine55 synthase
MTGVLLIDKPSGPTSHDVVARVRRSSGEKSIGHTGTLDPRATGLLPLVLGQATRLASLLSGGDKTYEATVRLGFATDTDDADGAGLTEPSPDVPDDARIMVALERLRRAEDQLPPSHSAKRIGGVRAYALARRAEVVDLKRVPVTVRALEWLNRSGDLLRIRLTVSTGFYVRAFARDLGDALGCGAHLAELRRTGSGDFSVVDAVPLHEAEAMGREVAARLVTSSDALPRLPAVEATEAGLRRVRHGNAIGPEHIGRQWIPELARAEMVRILGEGGLLVALAKPRGGALHPVVVLG